MDAHSADVKPASIQLMLFLLVCSFLPLKAGLLYQFQSTRTYTELEPRIGVQKGMGSRLLKEKN